MRLFGFDFTISKAMPQATPVQPVAWPGNWGGGSWSGWFWPRVHEPFTGAWQRNMELRLPNVLAFHAVYACVTLIASDISKLRIRLVEQDADGIWSEIDRASPFWPVLRKPNRFQNRIQFLTQWVISKLLNGNAYVLKERDERGIVVRLYVLDPMRVKPMVADDSSIWYDLSRDPLSGIEEEDPIRVPASEIIHDRMVPLYHPLCGTPPIIAYGLPAIQGLNIQTQSASFFSNNCSPGGVLSAPGIIQDQTAKRLKDHWEANYTGANVGKVAVLGDGLKYEQMSVNADDAQLIEQLKWSAETVCTCFHVPPYMIGVGPPPNYANIEALNQQYYTQCLQTHLESIELCLDEGLGLDAVPGKVYGSEFDLSGLLRMDTATRVKAAADAINAGFLKPDEARAEFDRKPVPGGDTPYLQQQYFSLAAHNKRDTSDDPFGQKPPPAPEPDDEEEEPEPDEAEDEEEANAAARNLADILLTRAKRYNGSPAGSGD